MHWTLLATLFLSVSAISGIRNDPSEKFPGGSGTTSDFSVQAFSHPMSGTRGQDRRDFAVGNSFFNSVWVSSPASTTARDGLGPIYNAVSCSSCHFKDGRGRGLPDTDGKVDVSLLMRLRVKGIGQKTFLHPLYGGQFQPQGIPGVPGEGEVFVSFQKISIEYPDGLFAELLKPVYEFFNLRFGSIGEETIVSPRVAPHMSGLGLIENIPEEAILRNEDPYDLDGDGISGRANWVFSPSEDMIKLGRFGWKAGKAALKDQNAAAFNGDIGITSHLFPKEECTDLQTECQNHRSINDIDEVRLEHVTTYTQLLSVPARRDFEKINVTQGKEVFHRIGCAQCHIPHFTTGKSASFNTLNDQKIYPYTDLLLHDMGDALADDPNPYFNEDLATTREWRTPPLWGLGLIQTVNGHTRYLHDGRARNLEEAILWHGGEGDRSKNNFVNLPVFERKNLIEFLNSL